MVEENKIQDFIKEAQGGDTAAFGAIYDIFSQRIYNFVFARTKHQQTAEDLMATVFLKAWTNLKQYQQRPTARFSTWLFQIANFTLIDHWRTRKDTVELDKIENLSSFTQDPKLYEDYEFLWIAISQLPLEYQSVLDLRFKQDFSVTETARIMNKSKVGIRVMQHRALKLLKEKLKNVNIDETI